MSGQKVPPSQLTLTQMSSNVRKRRSADSSQLSLGKNTRRHETVTSSLTSTVRSRSTAHYGGSGTDDQDAIDMLSPSEYSDEEKGKE